MLGVPAKLLGAPSSSSPSLVGIGPRSGNGITKWMRQFYPQGNGFISMLDKGFAIFTLI